MRFGQMLCGVGACAALYICDQHVHYTGHEFTIVRLAPSYDKSNVAKAALEQAKRHELRAVQRCIAAAFEAQAMADLSIMGPSELARRMDTVKRGTSRSPYTMEELQRAYDLAVKRVNRRDAPSERAKAYE